MRKTKAIAATSALFLGAALAAAIPAAANASAQPAITASPAVNGYLSAVSASSSRDAWAVGSQTNGTAPSLAEHWNGRTWTRVTVPSLRGQYSGLGSVTDISPSDAWATGQLYDSAQILHWNGKAWSRVPIPSIGSHSLSTISAASASDIWAVGSGASLHWNGKTWTRIPSPAPPYAKYGAFLNGVTAVSADNIWAVGCTDGCQVQGAFSPQIEQWNGKTWKQAAAPVTPYGIYTLNSVAAASASDAWAVGGGGPGTALSGAIAHWNGRTWKLSPGISGTQFSGVTALSPGNAWAVGVAESGATGHALILHWNGKTWTRS